MSVDLANYTDALRREVSPPGSTTFAAVSDDVFLGYLSDAFWEVKLDGFVEPYSCSVDGIVTPLTGAAPDPLVNPAATAYDPNTDIAREQISLILLYAGIKIIRNRLLEGNTRFSAKAGPVEYTTENSANLLTEMLKELNAAKTRLLYLKTFNQDVSLIDAFSARSTSSSSYAGYLYDFYSGAFGTNELDASSIYGGIF